MSTALLLAASLLTITTSILSVQIPRYLERQAADQIQHVSSIQPVTAAPPTRKPWDPPFPKPPKQMEKKESWLALPLMLNPHEDVQTDGTDEIEQEEEGEEGEEERQGKHHVAAINHLIWTTVAILSCALLLCLFAILIAHSLATFIVYKTEARLGEARRGIAQGGEMRLCLCARG